MASETKDKQETNPSNESKVEEEASADGLQSLSISSLFKVFDSIRPDKTPYDIIRTFQTFIRNLVSEFEECRQLCLKSLDSKQKLFDVQYIDALPCQDKTDPNTEDSEEVFKDAKEEAASSTVSKEELVSGNVDVPPVVEARVDPLDQGFVMLESVRESHHFKKNNFSPVDPKTFFSAVRKETNLLKTCLPKGIHVRGFESRMDLFSSMIEGPSNTPYEDGLFFFDVQLSPDYPKSPPKLHYVSYCSDRLNPNLYEDGKVCVSLLGTWSGRGTEIWNPSESNLLQVLVSIQGLILNPEPYYNEAGYEKQKGSQLGMENCRMYNEMAIIKLVQSMTKVVVHPYDVFEMEIIAHLRQNSEKFVNRLRSWSTISTDSTPSTPEMKKGQSPDNRNASPARDGSSVSPASEVSATANTTLFDGATTTTSTTEDTTSTAISTPALDDLQHSSGFPLFPASRGFKITLSKCLDQFVSAAVSRSILPNQ